MTEQEPLLVLVSGSFGELQQVPKLFWLSIIAKVELMQKKQWENENKNPKGRFRKIIKQTILVSNKFLSW